LLATEQFEAGNCDDDDNTGTDQNGFFCLLHVHACDALPTAAGKYRNAHFRNS
jgi:hypothetical protein